MLTHKSRPNSRNYLPVSNDWTYVEIRTPIPATSVLRGGLATNGHERTEDDIFKLGRSAVATYCEFGDIDHLTDRMIHEAGGLEADERCRKQTNVNRCSSDQSGACTFLMSFISRLLTGHEAISRYHRSYFQQDKYRIAKLRDEASLYISSSIPTHLMETCLQLSSHVHSLVVHLSTLILQGSVSGFPYMFRRCLQVRNDS